MLSTVGLHAHLQARHKDLSTLEQVPSCLGLRAWRGLEDSGLFFSVPENERHWARCSWAGVSDDLEHNLIAVELLLWTVIFSTQNWRVVAKFDAFLCDRVLYSDVWCVAGVPLSR